MFTELAWLALIVNLQVNFLDLGFLIWGDESKNECWETNKQKLKNIRLNLSLLN